MTNHRPARTKLFSLAVAAALLVVPAAPRPACADTATAAPSRTFASPDDAVAALMDAVRREDAHALRAILGPGSEELLDSGDRVADHLAHQKFVEAYDEKHVLVPNGPDEIDLTVGANDWPLPLPLVRQDGQWHFDSRAGAQEMVDRRIGRNEIAAIRTALAYVDAQKLYFEQTGEHGTAEYAQRLVSTPGKHDGLYWPAADDEPESPLAPLIQQAEDEGYPGEIVGGKAEPYAGYYFHILKGQGPEAPGGAMSYLSGRHMTKGFALVAWPARYGASGIMTFVVNQDGVVFQNDLGPDTDTLAPKMTLFDPDLDWARVDLQGG